MKTKTTTYYTVRMPDGKPPFGFRGKCSREQAKEFCAKNPGALICLVEVVKYFENEGRFVKEERFTSAY